MCLTNWRILRTIDLKVCMYETFLPQIVGNNGDLSKMQYVPVRNIKLKEKSVTGSHIPAKY